MKVICSCGGFGRESHKPFKAACLLNLLENLIQEHSTKRCSLHKPISHHKGSLLINPTKFIRDHKPHKAHIDALLINLINFLLVLYPYTISPHKKQKFSTRSLLNKHLKSHKGTHLIKPKILIKALT